MTALPSFVRSFDFGARKYCLFEHNTTDDFSIPSKLGAIGRVNTPEYETAFPKLPARALRTKIHCGKEIDQFKLGLSRFGTKTELRKCKL